MWWMVQVAGACEFETPAPALDAWLVDGQDIPTDARIVVLPGAPLDEVVLTRLDTSEAIGLTDEGWVMAYTGGRLVYTPTELLAPSTEYQVELRGNGEVAAKTTFTTGDGPTAAVADPPIVDAITTPGWHTEEVSCAGTHRESFRTLHVDVTLPAGLEPGTYLGLSSPGMPEQDESFLPVAADGSVTVEQAASSIGSRADRSCLTPRLVLPSGAEVVGDEVCAGGCATTPVTAGWAAGLLLLWARRQRVR